MTVKLSPAAVLAFVAGLAALIFALTGRDMSPRQSVAESPHSTVSLASSDTAWQANRSTIQRPGPEQVTAELATPVTVLQPTIIVEEGYGGSAEAQSQADIAQSQVDADTADVASAGGWRTPNPELSMEEEETGDSTNPHPDTATEPTTAKPAATASRFAQTMEDGSVFDPASYAPCTSDDGSGPRPCFWNAAERGNGQGTSFFVAANGNVSTFG